MPFGPEISWPNGFRPLDTGSREVLESAYGTGPVYQQPALDDYGYGDPGYSDPSYDGPRTPYGGPAFPGRPGGGRNAQAPRDFGGSGGRDSGPGIPGYQVPGFRDAGRHGHAGPGYQPDGFGYQWHDVAPSASGPDIWPVTGAQQALPDTGPPPAAGRRDGPGSGGFPQAGSAAYPDQWYGHPQFDDRVLEDRLPGGPQRPGGPPSAARPADPRLAGMNYDELRYDDPDPMTPGDPGYDEPMDDESWFRELRRSAPAYPQRSGGPQGTGGSQRRAEPQVPGHGQQHDYPQAPDRAGGYGPPRGDWAGPGPQMSAGPMTGPGPRAGQPGSGFPQDPSGLLGAPTAQGGVGVLTPAGTQVDGDAAAPGLAPPDSAWPGTGTVRPGHALDGPEITASWPARPQADDLESFEEFWREGQEVYPGLFGDEDPEPERTGIRPAGRRTGRRRGRSNDHRLWLGLGGVIVVAAAAIAGVIKFEFPSHGGPAHTMATPARIGAYTRTVDLEHQADVAALRAKVIKMSAGKASHVVSAVYESGNSAAGSNAQIVMFIGGHLANADPGASVTSFTQQFMGAKVVSAGPLGGKAACVEDGTVAMCAWFDNDSFGEVVSPTMNATALAKAMQTVRPSVELVAEK